MIALQTVFSDVRRHALLLLPLLAGLAGCQGRRPAAAAPAGSKSRRAASLDLSALGTDRNTTLRALRMPPHQLGSSLGAHRLSCTSRLVTRAPGHPVSEVNQQVNVRVDDQRQYAAIRNTHPQYGQEVISTEGLLYPRLRWGKFLRRRPEPNEPSRLLDRLAGLLPAYVGLLRRFLDIQRVGRTTHLGRETVRVKLALDANPAPARVENSPARLWRQSLAVSRLEGEALLDARSGAPLKVELTARWRFNGPEPGPLPTSGIPQQLDPKLVLETDLRFSLNVSDIGHVAAIEPPPEADTIDSPRLTRIEIERQMLTGELPVEDRWGPP